ncbi:hypothetical protein ROHU_034812 [Labeo rohita]|uniref:Uncharacterized protein n=1 Tax=Labeo rohita TaxID=84645 RepID=A0A498L746_LABRO|nr:hypothetical protein ROHU_034812 [Labeo rohita]
MSQTPRRRSEEEYSCVRELCIIQYIAEPSRWSSLVVYCNECARITGLHIGDKKRSKAKKTEQGLNA